MASQPSGLKLEIETNDIIINITSKKQPDISKLKLSSKLKPETEPSKWKSQLTIWGNYNYKTVKVGDGKKQDREEKSYFFVDGEITDKDKILDAKPVNIKNDQGVILQIPEPWFFEQVEYEITAQAKSGLKLWFQHDDAGIQDSLKDFSGDDESRLHGSVNFRNNVGLSKLVFSDEQGHSLTVEIEVFPAKISYKEDYQKMLEDINEMAESAAIDLLKSTFTRAQKNDSHDPVQAVYFRMLDQLFDKFCKAVNRIMAQPNHKLVSEYAVLPAHKIKRIDSKTYQWIPKHSEKVKRENDRILVSEALANKRRITYDTVENQIVKHILSSTVNKLSDFRKKYSKQLENKKYYNPESENEDSKGQKTSERILNKIDNMVSILRRHLKNPVFKEVSRLKSMETMSLVLRVAPGYRELYRYYQILKRSITFQGDVFELPMKDIAVLYEYWCFLKLVKMMKNTDGIKLVGKDVIEADRTGITVKLYKGKDSVVKFKSKDGKKEYELYYNRVYFNEFMKIPQKPDCILVVKDGEKEYQYVFDAKYRVEMNPGEEYPRTNKGGKCDFGPELGDINTMHRYRDAIVDSCEDVEGFRLKRLIYGAYVLFPYPGLEDDYESNHPFYESINKVDIGALPFLPDKTDLVKEHLGELAKAEYNEAKNYLPMRVTRQP